MDERKDREDFPLKTQVQQLTEDNRIVFVVFPRHRASSGTRLPLPAGFRGAKRRLFAGHHQLLLHQN
jgi:hypothetical protein